jgi:hypothetical protein
VSSTNSDFREVQVIDNWASGARQNEQLEKTPSRIAYPDENTDFDDVVFGYDVPPGVRSYTWVKLRIDDHASETQFDNPHLRGKLGHGLLELPPGKTSKEVTSDIFKCLKDHAMTTLGPIYTPEQIDVTPIDHWITYPASWEDESIEATKQAALLAGIGKTAARRDDRLFLITEPEAAAMYILTDATDKNPGLYKVRLYRSRPTESPYLNMA